MTTYKVKWIEKVSGHKRITECTKVETSQTLFPTEAYIQLKRSYKTFASFAFVDCEDDTNEALVAFETNLSKEVLEGIAKKNAFLYLEEII
jgi:DNA replication initiation complex subunit (GINS family)